MMMPAMQPAAVPDRPILVVDDDAKIVRLVRTYLERDGFSVVTAADGPAALDAIESHQPALVVLVVRVKAILRRTGAATETTRPTASVMRHNDLVLDPARHDVTVAGATVQLTHVEFRLLQTLLEADGRVLSRDQLLDAVYGADQNEVLDRTIDVHIRRLR